MKTINTKFITNSSTVSFSIIIETDKIKDYVNNISKDIHKITHDTCTEYHSINKSELENKLITFVNTIKNIQQPYTILHFNGEDWDDNTFTNYTILSDVYSYILKKPPLSYGAYTYNLLFQESTKRKLFQKLNRYTSSKPYKLFAEIEFKKHEDLYKFLKNIVKSDKKTNIIKFEYQIKRKINNIKINDDLYIDQLTDNYITISTSTLDSTSLNTFIEKHISQIRVAYYDIAYVYDIDVLIIDFDEHGHSYIHPAHSPSIIYTDGIVIPCIEEVLYLYCL